MGGWPVSTSDLEERLDAVLFASPSHRSITRLANALEPLTASQQEKVLHWASVTAKTNAEIGYLLATLAPKAFALLDDAAFDAWILAALDVYDRVGLRPAMEQLRALERFQAERAGTPLTRLADVQDRLARFVQGLSGRPLVVREAAAGSRPWTDTEALHLPDVLAVFDSHARNRQLYKAMAAMLWAQSRYGTFNVDLAAALDRFADPANAGAWLVMFESMRHEACIRRELPGLADDIAEVRVPWPAGLCAAAVRLGASSATVTDSLACVGEMLATGVAPPLPAYAGVLAAQTAGRVRAERIARDTATLREIIGDIGDAALPAPTIETVGADIALRIDGQLVALPPPGQAAARSLIQDLGTIPPEALVAAGPGPWRPQDGAPVHAAPAAAPPPGVLCYDEWDHHRRAHRRGWCHVRELDVPPGDAAYVADVAARFAPQIRQVRRRFEMIRGEDRIIGRQPDGDEVDIDAVVDSLADRRSGTEPSTRLFSRRIRNERSLAAMFMVDMSGSTKGWVNDAEREALILLCEGIEAVGDAFAIYGFSGWTRTRCDIYRIKAFDDPYDAATRGRIAGIEAKDYTRMGVAIRHLTGLLAAQPVRHRLLVTLSDGRPDDFGDEYRGTYGIEDTRHALLEARDAGVRSYCVTIDREGAAYLGRMYGPGSFTVIDDARQLPGKLADIYRRLTR